MNAIFRTVATIEGIVFDACLLANYAVLNLLLSIAEADSPPFQPLWSKQIIEETYRAYTGPLAWDEASAQGLLGAMLKAFPNSMVSDHERWIPQCTNDQGDRHVLACAIEAEASTILTFNLRHFQEKHLAPWKVRALHPQDYLLELHNQYPNRIVPSIEEIARKRSLKQRREVTIIEHLNTLSTYVPTFSQVLLAHLQSRVK